MARVVQRRTSQTTLYLLIVFVFMFLVSAGLAVVWHIENGDLTKKITLLEEQNKKYVSSQEKNSPEVKKLISDYDTAQPNNKKTVYKALTDQIGELTYFITGKKSDTNSTADAAAAIELAKQTVGTRTFSGFVTEWQSALTTAASEEEQKLKAIKERDQAIKSIEDYLAKLNDEKGKFTKEAEDLQKQLASLQDEIAAEKEMHIKDVNESEERGLAASDDLNKRIAVLTAKTEELNIKISKLEAEKAELQRRIDKATGPGIGTLEVAYKIDGKVLRVADDGETCYISIGKSEHVRPGLTFSVYPPSGVPENGEGKAKLVVTKVMDDISECRIVESKKTDPVNPDDTIANIAFDPQRTYVFVVEGSFDLYNTGKATPLGASEVKAMIREAGGKIADKVTVETDFVVMGEIPSKPHEPAENAEPSSWEVYREQLKVYQRYEQVMKQAQSLSKPILNANSFLAFMGYTPIKTLSR